MLSSAIIYLELFVALFFLPGFFITVILGIKKFRFLLSFALSYSLIVFTLLPFEYYAQPIARWQWCVLSEWVILALWAAAPRNAGQASLPSASHGWLRRPNLLRGLLNSRLTVPLVLAGVICGYLAYAGPYLEIPSDAWTHVYRFQWHKLNIINNGVFPSDLSWDSLLLHNTSNFWHFNAWYFIPAWLCHISGLPIMESLHVLTFVNVLVFLLAIYYFGLYLFAGLRISALKKTLMAAMSSLFAAATIGNMVFAYIRYYAFAPTILNYVLFLAAMALIIAWLRSHRWLEHALWIAPVLLLGTSLIHPQESLFIFFMTMALCLVETIRIFWQKIFSLARHSRNQNVIPAQAGIQEKKLWIPIFMGMTKWIDGTAGQSDRDNRWTAREWKPLILAAVLLLIFFAGFIVIRHFKPGAWISANMIMPHVGIPPEPVNFIFRDLLISPPVNPYFRLAAYQLFVFYQAIGCWGLFVYLLFVVQFRQFVKLPYLTAGLLIVPLLTAFNPLTVDIMVRMGQDPVLYRFHYLIPLPFVAGCLLVHSWERMRAWLRRMRLSSAKAVSPIWPRLSWINFAGYILILAGLIGLLWPINGIGIYAPYSKIYTLRKIPAGNDYHLWEDLGKVIERFENKIILMDCLTRFMIYYSLSNNCLYSKWLNSQNPERDLPEPYIWDDLRACGMIIINRRDGAPSVTGKIAKHWPEDVLEVSRYYSLEAQNYLESHPEKFQKIWDQNRIAVYAVR